MPAALTRTRQETEIGEGLAVGCLVAGVHAIGATAALDTALLRALEPWPWAARYPAVRRTPRLDDILRRSAAAPPVAGAASRGGPRRATRSSRSSATTTGT
ncbi:hypothetical protein [Actinomycetospora succinea]|uniref:hypothetical protein n=1 Tax=Actinomycetospora succinea TaxID=663603 RepID=UPI00105CE83B|nr:hypothetical protein [Actinomycetospora succinea]